MKYSSLFLVSLIIFILVILDEKLRLYADTGELVVVVNATSDVKNLTQEQVINIFLGRFKQLPNGMTAYPIDQPFNQSLRANFYQRLVHKTPAEIQSYWARLVFSGKTAPPRQADTPQEVIKWLTETPGAIGYLEPQVVPPTLRVVLSLAASP